MDIKLVVNKLIKKYGTNDPSQLAAELGITIIYKFLGESLGFCLSYKRQKIIVINENCPDELLNFTIAHELGHAILHKRINTPFLKKHTLVSIDKIERQANTFAVELLLPDNILKEYEDINFYCLAQCAGIPNGLESLKSL
ncbi:ImmA/IrrE family metallo-endopeptidase [Veillonella sp.]|uniref:ImmA/IrrE family metallo-endopeptidase n=1 Tax=Veillonella sp. TaxID=1926307 RepID=UPI0025D5F6FC|nr:ImmA/IrrE family metallo-endopeptidase [Veillonella sp.]